MPKKKFKDNPFKSRKARKGMKRTMLKVSRMSRQDMVKQWKKYVDEYFDLKIEEARMKLLQGEPQQHDMNACNALKEYQDAWNNPFRVGPVPNMGHVARKYGTTMEEMKKHRVCYNQENRLNG